MVLKGFVGITTVYRVPHRRVEVSGVLSIDNQVFLAFGLYFVLTSKALLLVSTVG